MLSEIRSCTYLRLLAVNLACDTSSFAQVFPLFVLKTLVSFTCLTNALTGRVPVVEILGLQSLRGPPHRRGRQYYGYLS